MEKILKGIRIIIILMLVIILTPKPKEKNKIEQSNQIEEKVASESINNITNRHEVERVEIKEVSQIGIDLIKKYEGCKLTSYKLKGENYYTIGYGHYDSSNYEGQAITQEQAENLLKNDLKEVSKIVYKKCKHLQLNQNEFDALVSFTYNLGEGNLQKLIQNRNKQEIGQAMLLYTKSSSETNREGLKKRRNEEKQLFEKGEENE